MAAKAKRMRLPNGFGQISEIKNRNLRKPFRAMVTVGTAENGRPICKLLEPEAYFKTYNEAYSALVKYHENPQTTSDEMTIEELYTKWSEEHYKTISSKTISKYTLGWSNSSDLHNMKISAVKPLNIKEVMDKAETISIKQNIKMLYNVLYDYAIEFELVDRNPSRSFKTPKEITNHITTVQKDHIAYNEEEISILWKNIDNEIAATILIQCYSGWRPQELLNLKIEDIDLESGFFKGGMKTKAGKNRIVPIHSKILPLIRKRYDPSQEYLFNIHNYKIFYGKFKIFINEVNINPNHRPHDGRKTFITLAKKYHLDEYAIKYIAGHAIYDLTEKVYTERDPEWLKSEIEKIKEGVGIV